jgi:hypothetical protein
VAFDQRIDRHRRLRYGPARVRVEHASARAAKAQAVIRALQRTIDHHALPERGKAVRTAPADCMRHAVFVAKQRNGFFQKDFGLRCGAQAVGPARDIPGIAQIDPARACQNRCGIPQRGHGSAL